MYVKENKKLLGTCTGNIQNKKYKQEVKMKLEEFLQQKYNYNPEIKDAIQSYIEQWKSWYKGNVKSFHNYFI